MYILIFFTYWSVSSGIRPVSIEFDNYVNCEVAKTEIMKLKYTKESFVFDAICVRK